MKRFYIVENYIFMDSNLLAQSIKDLASILAAGFLTLSGFVLILASYFTNLQMGDRTLYSFYRSSDCRYSCRNYRIKCFVFQLILSLLIRKEYLILCC